MSEPIVHVALLPSAGMGHLTPFLRLAALLVHHNCRVTLITAQPTVSLAESDLISRFHSAFPQVNQLDFHLLPFDASTANSTDPFWLQFESIRRSASQVLCPLLQSLSPPLSAFVLDISLISPIIAVTQKLSLPSYVFFTSSARMFSFFSYFPAVAASSASSFPEVLQIPGISPVSRTSIPPPLLVRDHLFASFFKEDSVKLTKLDGILINTFEELDSEALAALDNGKIIEGLPPVFAVGPLPPFEFESVHEGSTPLAWLDDQPEGSVVYVSFGSRTALKRDQIREIGEGLMRSGCRFLWVVKDKPVDREEEMELEEVVGFDLMEKLKKKGRVVKTWVDQREILGHASVGGFVSHCGWNSVTEAAWYGVRILAWPQIGDQKINAEVVESSGLGRWVKDWGWGGKDVLKGEEIGRAIEEMMGNEDFKTNAAKIMQAAKRAVSGGGGCQLTFERLIHEWRKKDAAGHN